MSESIGGQQSVRPSMLRTVLVLGRTSNLPTVWTNVLAGWFLAGGSWDWQIAWLALAVSALYLGGMTLNDAFDVKWDRQHAPERPVPSGAISERAVWMLGGIWMVAGVLVASMLTDAGMVWLLALVAAILLYDWIHKKWSGAMWVMGACRALVYLMAGSATSRGMEDSWIGAWGICCYVAAITLLARGERGGVAKIPGVGFGAASVLLHTPLIVAVLSLPFVKIPTSGVVVPWIPMIVFAAAFFVGWITVLGRRRLRKSTGHGVVTLLAGIVVVDALFVSLVDGRTALICLAFLPLVRWLQMRIPAT